MQRSAHSSETSLHLTRDHLKLFPTLCTDYDLFEVLLPLPLLSLFKEEHSLNLG